MQATLRSGTLPELAPPGFGRDGGDGGGGMGLVVDVEKVRRGRQGSSIAFVLWAQFAHEPDATDLRRLSEQVSRTFGGVEPPFAEQWIKSARGWSAVLMRAPEFRDGLRWLQLFADSYGDDVEGTVAGQTRLSGGGLGRKDVTRGPVTGVAYATGDLRKANNGRNAAWYVHPGVTSSLVAAAQGWVVTPGCRRWITRNGGYWGMEMEGLDWKQGWFEAIHSYVNAEVVTRQTKPTRMRKVSFWPHGRVTYAAYDPSLSLVEKLDLARQPLAFAVEHTNVAFIATRYPVDNVWWPSQGSDDDWAYLHESEVRYNEPLLASMVPDAHGIQVLTRDHLDRAANLDDWSVKCLGHDRYLVEARDLEVWYAGPSPDRAARDKAQADFGDMIINRELIEANFPWTSRTDLPGHEGKFYRYQV